MSLRHQGKLLKFVIDSNGKASVINFQRWYCASLRGKPPPPPKVTPTPGLVESIFHRRGSHQEKEEGEAPDWFKKFEKKMDEFEKGIRGTLEAEEKNLEKTQRIARKQDLKDLEDIVERRLDLMQKEYQPIIEAMSRKKDKSHRHAFAQKLLEMPSAERQEYLKMLAEKQQAEKKRLDARLEEMKLLDNEFKKQAEDEEQKETKK